MAETGIFERFWEIVTERDITDVGILPCDKLRGVIEHFPKTLNRYDLTREEEGVGISAGAYLAGARPLLLIQSTGLGNSLNALMSLNKAYGIPLPIVTSWRGAEDEKVEAQKPLGSHLEGILKAAGIIHIPIRRPEKLDDVGSVIDSAYKLGEPAVALVAPSTWTRQPNPTKTLHPQNYPEPIRRPESVHNPVKAKLTRYQAIETIVDAIDDKTVLVCNIGDPSRELYAIRDRPLNFYMTGSLGLASSIGLGIAEHASKEVWVIDGDGSLLANPNALIQIAARRPRNLKVICLDNQVHGSTGGQPTLSRYIDLSELAGALGAFTVSRCNDGATFKKPISTLGGPAFIHYRILPGNAGAPTIPLSNAEIRGRFMKSFRSSAP